MPVSSVERPVSALRQRMLEDMAMRGLRSHTQHDYIRFVRSFAGFLGRSPDTAQAEDIRRFQVHQREIGVQPPTINGSVSALRFFFNVTLDRPDLSRRLGQSTGLLSALPMVPGCGYQKWRPSRSATSTARAC
jgi:integrase/recombinase XerD